MCRCVRVCASPPPFVGVHLRQGAGDVAHLERYAAPVALQGQGPGRCGGEAGRGPWGRLEGRREAQPGRLGGGRLPADLRHRGASLYVGRGLTHVLHWKGEGSFKLKVLIFFLESERLLPKTLSFSKCSELFPKKFTPFPLKMVQTFSSIPNSLRVHGKRSILHLIMQHMTFTK